MNFNIGLKVSMTTGLKKKKSIYPYTYAVCVSFKKFIF